MEGASPATCFSIPGALSGGVGAGARGTGALRSRALHAGALAAAGALGAGAFTIAGASAVGFAETTATLWGARLRKVDETLKRIGIARITPAAMATGRAARLMKRRTERPSMRED